MTILASLLLAPALGSVFAGSQSHGKIAFMRATTSAPFVSHIVVMRADGGDQLQVTTGDVFDFEPAWSPDGRVLAFERRVKSRGTDIYLVNANGTGLRQLTNSRTATGVAWSPDGRKIAYARAAPLARKHGGLFLTSPTVGGARRLGPALSDVWGITWSPDGRRIAFATTMGVIYVVNVDGSGARRLTRARFYGGPVWSPDGSAIAFVRGPPFHYDSIYVVKLDGGREQLLTRHAYTEPGFAWSPDGRRIVYSREQRGGVYVIDADGRHDRRLTRDPVPRDLIAGFAWSPDRRTIAYTSDRTGNGDIYVLRVRDGRRRQLTDSPDADGKPIWWEPH